MSRTTDKLNKLASRMVQKALEDNVTLDMQVKVFSALTGYYSAQNKAKKPEDEDTGKATFNQFRERVARAEANGGGEDG